MSQTHNFEHLRLLRRYFGPAELRGGGKSSAQTKANRNARLEHSQQLQSAAQTLTTKWQERQVQRLEEGLPVIPTGIPILLQVDPGLDLDDLRKKYAFEIVAEQEDGYVIVAAEDIELGTFLAKVNEFSKNIHGSATIAQVHRLFDDPNQTERLKSMLSDHMFALWPNIDDMQVYIVDIGISCVGNQEIPSPPKRGKRTTDADWARKGKKWSETRAAAYDAWDEIKSRRETEIQQFAKSYKAEILDFTDGDAFNAAVLPDSFTLRLRIVGRGLKDFVLNYPFIFEVAEPDDISPTLLPGQYESHDTPCANLIPPDADAPTVCVLDSGIQEGHFLLEPAIDRGTSHCFLLQDNPTNVGDFVSPGGHGTRVSGAVLYAERIPRDGITKLPFWIQNARVLDSYNCMPERMFPPEVVRAVVERFHQSARRTKIITPSMDGAIAAHATCRPGQQRSMRSAPSMIFLLFRVLGTCQ